VPARAVPPRRRPAVRLPIAALAALSLALAPPPRAAPLPARSLAPGVWLVPGDTGRGAEGRPNAGFVVTGDGVVAVGGFWSPAMGDSVVATIRAATRRPLRWAVLYAHHPDMQVGTIALRRAGARVVAHPDTRVLASEGGLDNLVANWTPVVGVAAMLGFEEANVPDRPVTGTDTLVLGGRRLVLIHPGPAHSAGDLMLWLPDERVLFAGDILVEDGLTMVVDGESATLLRTLDLIDSLAPRVLVPGHGRLPADPRALTAATRAYVTGLREEMRAAVRAGRSLTQALATQPAADPRRPVAPDSRRRRNAVRVYLEMERAENGLPEAPGA